MELLQIPMILTEVSEVKDPYYFCQYRTTMLGTLLAAIFWHPSFSRDIKY